MTETSQSAKPQTNEFPFSVSVGTVYDGPLDLLLDLVRKQDIDIYDIPIAKITAQYLGYVENLKHLDVDVAAEFIYMASLLIHIKSKMLLPRDPDATAGELDDPRDELVQRRHKTVLLTTHDLEEMEALCDRVGILDGGRLRGVGAPDAIVQHEKLITVARQHGTHAGFRIDALCERASDCERHVLLARATVPNRARISAAVTGVHSNHDRPLAILWRVQRAHDALGRV